MEQGFNFFCIFTFNNRADCCWDRLGPVEIYVVDGANTILCGHYSCVTSDALPVNVICADDVIGNRIRIVAPGPSRVLSICEVVIHGKIIN